MFPPELNICNYNTHVGIRRSEKHSFMFYIRATIGAMIKLIALDLDGTLLNSDKQFPAEFPAWVKAHPDTAVVLASGRQLFTLQEQFSEIADRLWYIAENGALIAHAGEIIKVDSMSGEDVLEILDEFPGDELCEPLLCGLKSAYVRHIGGKAKEESTKYYARIEYNNDLRSCASQDKMLKIAIFVQSFRAEEVYNRLPERKKGLTALLSGDSWIDIANSTVEKGIALRTVREHLGVTREETAAFGDYLNDMTLLAEAGESYAMANAHPDLKRTARHVTRFTNDENGVMDVLSNW